MNPPDGWLGPRDRVRFRRLRAELGRALLDCICPPACAGCGKPSEVLCELCSQDLQRLEEPMCVRCGEPILSPQASCTRDHRPLTGLRWVRTPFRYAGTGGAMVRRLKFLRDPQAARVLCRGMSRCARDAARGSWRRSVLVSVPLHRHRLRDRGVDQAALLAEGLESALGLPYLPRCLIRRRATLPQGDPRVTSRKRNVSGAFSVRRRSPIRGRRVILVDDVVTSGSTARECALVLRDAGAEQVSLVAAARA